MTTTMTTTMPTRLGATTEPAGAPAAGDGNGRLLLVGGRVIDPETGYDEVADVLVDRGRIAAVGPGLSDGLVDPQDSRVDCAGLVVCPGFIDLHSHAQTLSGAWLQAFDGVTTALDLECGTIDVASALADMAEEGRPLHYGYSASWALARADAMGQPTSAPQCSTGFAAFQSLSTSSAWRRPVAEPERARMLDLIQRELESGAVGVGAMLGYFPESDRDELVAVARLTACRRSVLVVHSRASAGHGRPTALDAVHELLDVAAATRAHVHLCHVNSTSSVWMDEIATVIDAARSRGVQITVETYPYARGSTVVGASFLSPEELAREGRGPRSLTYLPTGESIADVARLEELRSSDPGGLVLTTTYDLADPEESRLFDLAMSIPHAAFASDAMPVTPDSDPRDLWPLSRGAVAHPRSAGCFTRVLRVLVRERGLLTLTEAIRRCTLVPADILRDAAPTMRRKGRLQPGADADVTVFDPRLVTDRATYEQLEPAFGVRHLLVAGIPVIRDGRLDTGARPGSPITGRGTAA